MNIVYYSDVCPDTPGFMEALATKDFTYEMVNITASMGNLKQFLRLRDNRSEFEAKKAQGQVGIPVLVMDDQVYFDSSAI